MATLSVLREIAEESQFKSGLPRKFGGTHAIRTYSTKHDKETIEAEVPEHIRKNVSKETAEAHVKAKVQTAGNEFDHMGEPSITRHKDQDGTHYYGVYGYQYHTPGKNMSKSFPKGQAFHGYVYHHLGTVKK